MLALDFDGVIAASAAETYLVAAATLAAMEPGFPLVQRLPRAEPGRLEHPDPEDPVYARFLEAMPLGNRAEDFAVVLRAIAEGVPLPDQAAYDRFRNTLEDTWLDAFHRRFYAVRRGLLEADPGGWLTLVRPYPGVPERIRRLAPAVQLSLATARDRGSIRRFLEAYGLDSLFPEEWLFDKEIGRSKQTHIERILERTGGNAGDILFVDDKVNHLEGVAGTGVRRALAGWGYNGPREHRRAHRLGIPVLRIEDLDPGTLETIG